MLQVIQHVTKMTIIWNLQFICYFCSSVSVTMCTEQAYNFHVRLSILKQRVEEPLIFIFQFWLSGKEKRIYVVWNILLWVKQTQIIRNTTKDHVRLQHCNSWPAEFSAFEIFFCLPKRERTEMHGVSSTFMESCFIINNITHHP